ncbi:MAG: helix-turn-helix domain-containing protein [Oscillospiraceae bacterium]
MLGKQHKSKADLARYLGIRPTTVTEWGTKGKKPSLEYVSRISEFLGVSCDYLLTGKEPIPKATMIEVPKPQLTENEQEMLSVFRMLSEREQLKEIGRLEKTIEQENVR